AGSSEQLVAAVNNGCDAVYLGLDNFNARMKAPNFTAQNLKQWVDFCHFFGVKVFVTVNTSVKNSEFADAVQTLLCAYSNNADGVIVTDLALLRFAASLPKPFEVVASTQLNTHDGYGAKFLKELGATTVVCARESSFDEIKQVVEVGVNVECFLHGALCVCQSGQCLFSSMVGGNSGNRGLCAQPCRKLYKANVGKFADGGYLLSASDICGLDSAKKLLDLGVTTFKIEGRNRRAEYAGATAQVYSQFFASNFVEKNRDRAVLEEAFNRGNLPACGYLSGKNSDIIYPLAQNHLGVAVGKIIKGKLFADVPLTKGDGLKVLNNGKEFCGGVALQSGKGFVLAEFSDKVKDGMTVRRTSSVELSQCVLSARRTRNVEVQFCAYANQKAVLTLVSQDVRIVVESDFVVQQAVQTPTSKEEIAKQLQKIGDLQYTITNIVVDIDDVFLAKSQINALRRQAFELLGNRIVERCDKAFENRLSANLAYKPLKKALPKGENCLAVVCYNEEQLVAASAKGVDYLIYKPQFLNHLPSTSVFYYLDLPSFADLGFVKTALQGKNCGVVCHNVGHVQFARENGLRYIAGSGLNVFNDEMVAIFHDADTFFYSQELTFAEISRFSYKNGLVFVDGDLVLMKLVHCPFKLALD
ncbi:MAG: U32 family peptidase, partial [Candidatus Fimimonas sp.]